MLYQLINNATSNRVVQSLRGQVIVPPQHTVKDKHKHVELSDSTAMNLRRLQSKGSELHITALTPEGEKVLEEAANIPPRTRPFNMVGNPKEDKVLEVAVEKDEIRDEQKDEPVSGTYSLDQVMSAMAGAGVGVPVPAADATAASQDNADAALAPTPARKPRKPASQPTGASTGRRRLRE